MKNIFNKNTFLVLIMTVIIGKAIAQLELKIMSINNGGGTLTGGAFVMRSSIAQVDASAAQIGSDFSLNGGFGIKTIHQNLN